MPARWRVDEVADAAVRELDMGYSGKVSSNGHDSHQRCSSEVERGGPRAGAFEGRTQFGVCEGEEAIGINIRISLLVSHCRDMEY